MGAPSRAGGVHVAPGDGLALAQHSGTASSSGGVLCGEAVAKQLSVLHASADRRCCHSAGGARRHHIWTNQRPTGHANLQVAIHDALTAPCGSVRAAAEAGGAGSRADVRGDAVLFVQGGVLLGVLQVTRRRAPPARSCAWSPAAALSAALSTTAPASYIGSCRYPGRPSPCRQQRQQSVGMDRRNKAVAAVMWAACVARFSTHEGARAEALVALACCVSSAALLAASLCRRCCYVRYMRQTTTVALLQAHAAAAFICLTGQQMLAGR